MSSHRCHYEERPDQLGLLRERNTIDPPAEECAGPINYRNGRIWFCETHGYWHHGVNPFGGYEQVET